uniref:Zinc finger protein 384-like n=1 Tax=Sinocyclocheilus grahami TaxID=75366 RepID=A0A672M622_SINGR
MVQLMSPCVVGRLHIKCLADVLEKKLLEETKTSQVSKNERNNILCFFLYFPFISFSICLIYFSSGTLFITADYLNFYSTLWISWSFLLCRNHTESKPHKCPHCTKSFANTSYLVQHVRIHTGVKPYTCNYCQKTFRQLSHLQQHHRIHTGDRPYKCSYPGCEKSFTQLSNLQSHRHQHNKDKPYKCHHCNRGYVDAGSLEVHLSTHTVKHDKLYSCGLCNHTYTSETYLMKHMRKHTPDMLPSPPGSNQQNHSSGHTGGSSSDGDGQSQAERNNAFIQPCIFDLNQYKSVPSADVQYKTVCISDISPHKDLCITVEASAIQVGHLNS